MKLTLHLKDGTTATSYISNGMLGELEKAIVTQRGYKEKSEIPDEDRVKIIVNSNEYLNVLDTDYRFDDIQSYEIDDLYEEDFRWVTEPIQGFVNCFEDTSLEKVICCFDMGTTKDITKTAAYKEAFECGASL